MVPQIYRQEVQVGAIETTSEYHDSMVPYSEQSPYTSPVNFFIHFDRKFPHFKDAEKFNVNLSLGDCVFIPAFYFYQVQGFKKMISPPGRSFPKLYENEEENKGGANYAGNRSYFKDDEIESYDLELATAISLKFEGNSELLEDFMDGIEKKHI